MNETETRPCRDVPRLKAPSRLPLAQKQVYSVYLSLGSNIEPAVYLPRAVDMLCDLAGVWATSQVWETPPDGMAGANFLNAVVLLRTQLTRVVLKTIVLRRVEVQLGRVRTFNKFSPRTIDLDILVYDDTVIEPALWTRPYLAVPLAELLPNLTHPGDGLTLQQVAANLRANTRIWPRPDVQLATQKA